MPSSTISRLLVNNRWLCTGLIGEVATWTVEKPPRSTSETGRCLTSVLEIILWFLMLGTATKYICKPFFLNKAWNPYSGTPYSSRVLGRCYISTLLPHNTRLFFSPSIDNLAVRRAEVIRSLTPRTMGEIQLRKWSTLPSRCLSCFRILLTLAE